MARRPRPRPKHAGSSRPGVSVSPAAVTVVLVGTGVALRLWQYFANASLWLDEAALARNIIDRPALALFQPLDYAQVAPPGFLLAEKLMVTMFGGSEWSLRLFPLLCGLAAIALFWRIAIWTLTGWEVTYAVGLFALATPLVYFSSHVKQYSSDISAAVLVLYCAIWLRQQPGDVRRAITVGLVGAAVVWFSQPSVFVLMGAGAALAISALAERRWPAYRSVIIVGAAWTVSAALAGALALRNISASDRAYLDVYWHAGFMPMPPRTAADLLWIWEHLTWVFGKFITGLRRTNGGLGYPWSQLFVVLAVAGVVGFWRRQRDIALILLNTVLVVLVAAALHLYPFTGRVVSFLVPVFLLATASGAAYVLSHWPERLQFASPALLALAVGSPLYATLVALPPERAEHLRPILSIVAERRQPGDDIYVYYGAGQTFMYYAPRFGFTRSDFVLGRCSVTDLRVYLQDLDRFRGRARVWIVATHARLGAVELQTMIRYLNAIGRRLEYFEERATLDVPSIAAYAYLYDLSDPSRLRAASAEAFPLPTLPADEGLAQWGCYGTQSTLGRF